MRGFWKGCWSSWLVKNTRVKGIYLFSAFSSSSSSSFWEGLVFLFCLVWEDYFLLFFVLRPGAAVLGDERVALYIRIQDVYG